MDSKELLMRARAKRKPAEEVIESSLPASDNATDVMDAEQDSRIESAVGFKHPMKGHDGDMSSETDESGDSAKTDAAKSARMGRLRKLGLGFQIAAK